MKQRFLKKTIGFLATVFWATVTQAQSPADSVAIMNIINEEVVAWNNGDAQTYAKHFATDGTFTNILGTFFVGQNEFQARHDQIFKGIFNKTVMKQETVSFKFANPDAVIVETLTWVSGFSNQGPPRGAYLDEKGRLRTRLLQVMIRQGNAWKIVAYHNVDVKQGIPVPEPR
jgi:uncharacterized protein (TIGR02246 family)